MTIKVQKMILPSSQEVYWTVIGEDHLPIARDFAKEVISLPIGPHLSNEELKYVIHEVKSVTNKN